MPGFSVNPALQTWMQTLSPMQQFLFQRMGAAMNPGQAIADKVAGFTSWETAQWEWVPDDQAGPSRIWGGTSWLASKSADYGGANFIQSPNEAAAQFMREQAWKIYDSLAIQNARPDRNPDQIAAAVSQGIISNPWDAPGLWGFSPAMGSSFGHGLHVIEVMLNEPVPLARRNGVLYSTPPELHAKNAEFSASASQWAVQVDRMGKTPTGLKAAIPVVSTVLAVIGAVMAVAAIAGTIAGATGAAGSAASSAVGVTETGALLATPGELIAGGAMESLGVMETAAFAESMSEFGAALTGGFSGTEILAVTGLESLTFSGFETLAGDVAIDLPGSLASEIASSPAPLTEGSNMFDILDFGDTFADAADLADFSFDQIINDIPGFDFSDFGDLVPDMGDLGSVDILPDIGADALTDIPGFESVTEAAQDFGLDVLTETGDALSLDFSDIGTSIFEEGAGTNYNLLTDIPGYQDAAAASASASGGSPVDWITKLIREGVNAYKQIAQIRQGGQRPSYRPGVTYRPTARPGANGQTITLPNGQVVTVNRPTTATGPGSILTAPAVAGFSPLQIGAMLGGAYLIYRVTKGK